jgi:hypothetical protein
LTLDFGTTTTWSIARRRTDREFNPRFGSRERCIKVLEHQHVRRRLRTVVVDFMEEV